MLYNTQIITKQFDINVLLCVYIPFKFSLYNYTCLAHFIKVFNVLPEQLLLPVTFRSHPLSN